MPSQQVPFESKNYDFFTFFDNDVLPAPELEDCRVGRNLNQEIESLATRLSQTPIFLSGDKSEVKQKNYKVMLTDLYKLGYLYGIHSMTLIASIIEDLLDELEKNNELKD